MPFYDYFCEANGQTVEVKHPASVRLKTWKEVCEMAGIKVGNIKPDAGVTRLIGMAMPSVKSLKSVRPSACGLGDGGHGGGCSCCH